MSISLTPMLTPPELAKRWKVSPDKIVGFIRSGLLRAADLSSATSSRPRFRIDMADVLAFEAARSARPTPKPLRKSRRAAAEVISFF
jgi:hypothetical protein